MACRREWHSIHPCCAAFSPPPGALDADLREAFFEKLRVRWTHTSTALEGNSLSECETSGVLRHGLTIAGKPLSHHNEVVGHSRALDLLYAWAEGGRVLQEAVQTSVAVDYLKPVGAWKREPNSTLAKQGGAKHLSPPAPSRRSP